MISISNQDRDKAVEFLKAFASLLREHGMQSTKQMNARRMALNLAVKLKRKLPVPAQSGERGSTKITEKTIKK